MIHQEAGTVTTMAGFLCVKITRGQNVNISFFKSQ